MLTSNHKHSLPWRQMCVTGSEITVAVNSSVCTTVQQKKKMKAYLIGPVWGNPLVIGGFPSQRASNAESVSMAWPPVLWSSMYVAHSIRNRCRPCGQFRYYDNGTLSFNHHNHSFEDRSPVDLWVTDLQISWSDLTSVIGYQNSSSSNGRQATCPIFVAHYNDVIMSTAAPQIISLTIVYSIVHSGADQRKHQNSASLAFVRGIHRWPVNSPHKRPVMRKMFPFDDFIMVQRQTNTPILHIPHEHNYNHRSTLAWGNTYISSPILNMTDYQKRRLTNHSLTTSTTTSASFSTLTAMPFP